MPELGHTLGKAIKNFKDSVSGVEEAAFRRLPPEAGSQKDALSKAALQKDSTKKKSVPKKDKTASNEDDSESS